MGKLFENSASIGKMIIIKLSSLDGTNKTSLLRIRETAFNTGSPSCPLRPPRLTPPTYLARWGGPLRSWGGCPSVQSRCMGPHHIRPRFGFRYCTGFECCSGGPHVGPGTTCHSQHRGWCCGLARPPGWLGCQSCTWKEDQMDKSGDWTENGTHFMTFYALSSFPAPSIHMYISLIWFVIGGIFWNLVALVLMGL